MKKIISIVAILFCFVTLYGQDTKPTKLETMEWIAGKMKQYLINDGEHKRFYVSYTNGMFTYKVYVSANNDKSCGYYLISIHLDRITDFRTLMESYEGRQDNVTATYKRLVIKGNRILTRDTSNTYYCEDIQKDDDNEVILGHWDYDPDSDNPIFNFDIEDGLRARAINAIFNLVNYNVNKDQKEAY